MAVMIDRRSFLQGTIQGALALSPLAAAGASAADPLAIVDTHQHLWDLERLHPPWLAPGGELTRNYFTQEYLEATRGLNVIKAVYMEVAVSDAQLVDEAELIVELCRKPGQPTCAAVIGGRPASPGFASYINRFKGSPYVKGVRHIMRQPEMLEAEGLVAGLRLLGELGMCFDLCVATEMLAQSARLVDACPETRFVIDHCGNADPVAFLPESSAPRAAQHDAGGWRRAMEALAKRKNTICKISGIVSRMEKGKWTAEQLAPVVNLCLDTFGPERVVFASDWPVCTRGATLGEWVTALKQIVSSRPIGEQRKLFAENAIAFYKLA